MLLELETMLILIFASGFGEGNLKHGEAWWWCGVVLVLSGKFFCINFEKL